MYLHIVYTILSGLSSVILRFEGSDPVFFDSKKVKKVKKNQRVSCDKAPKCANFVRIGAKPQLDYITKPFVILLTNGSVISYSLSVPNALDFLLEFKEA